MPAINQHKQQNLKRKRYHDRRQHEHTHTHENTRHHHIDDKKWNEQHKPHLERCFQLRNNKRRNQGECRDLAFIRGLGIVPGTDKERYVILPRLFEHELPEGNESAVEGFALLDFLVEIGFDSLIIDFVENRSHDKECQKERQPDQNLIGRHLLCTERMTEERQDDDDPGKRRQQNQECWRKTQQRYDEDDLDGYRHILGSIVSPDLDIQPREPPG